MKEIEEEYEGTFRGDLEYMNLHESKNVMRLYPKVGPKIIYCHFPPDLKDKATASMGKRVEIVGIFKYRKGAPYPYKAEVKDIIPFPPDSELPSFYDLLGSNPNITGGLSSEEYLRKIRHDN